MLSPPGEKGTRENIGRDIGQYQIFHQIVHRNVPGEREHVQRGFHAGDRKIFKPPEEKSVYQTLRVERQIAGRLFVQRV